MVEPIFRASRCLVCVSVILLGLLSAPPTRAQGAGGAITGTVTADTADLPTSEIGMSGIGMSDREASDGEATEPIPAAVTALRPRRRAVSPQAAAGCSTVQKAHRVAACGMLLRHSGHSRVVGAATGGLRPPQSHDASATPSNGSTCAPPPIKVTATTTWLPSG